MLIVNEAMTVSRVFSFFVGKLAKFYRMKQQFFVPCFKSLAVLLLLNLSFFGSYAV